MTHTPNNTLNSFKKNGARLTFESIVFFLLVVVFCLPIVFITNYHTIDGPAHLYNATILKDLLLGKSAYWGQYYTLNSEPIPNWGGHILLSVLLCTGITAAWTNKLLILLYLITFAYSFRFFINKLFPSAIYTSYFIFLHLHNFQSYFGFYNFCLSIPVLLISMYTIVRFFETTKSKWLFYTGILSVLLFFFHLLPVMFLLLFTGSMFLIYSIKLLTVPKTRQTSIKQFTVIAARLVIAFTPVLALAGIYFAHRPPVLTKIYLTPAELLFWLVKVRSSVIYDWAIASYLMPIGIVTMVVLFYAATKTIGSQKLLTASNEHYKTLSLLVLTALTLATVFILPDEDGYGSIISVRLIFLFYVFASLFIASANLPARLVQAVAILSIIVGLYSWKQTLHTQRELSADIQYLQECNHLLSNNKTAIVINQNKNWLKGHYPNYIGLDKHIFVPDNYEASVGYFPLIWQQNLPYISAGTHSNDELGVYWKSNNQAKHEQTADYFIVIKDDNEDNFPQKAQIENDYTLLLNNKRVTAYQLKQAIE